jgi:imidazolonepropionase-like amidohydrolase
MASAGLLTAPRLFSTGTILYGAAGPELKAQVDDLEDARFHLGRMQATGAFSVKSYNQPRRDQRQQILAAARELDMLVMPEGGSLYEHNMTMVVDGHTGIEHSVPVETLYEDVLQLWSQTGTAYTPTLVVAYGGIWGENYWYATTDVWDNQRLLTFVPREQVDPLARRPFQAPAEEYNHFRIAAGAAALADHGVRVNVGAHGQREGLGAHWEIWMLVQGGASEMEALRSATWNGARYLGMDADLGSIEPGKLADLVVLDRDPLADIRNTESVALTMVGGRLYEAATMHELGNRPRERAPLFWE